MFPDIKTPTNQPNPQTKTNQTNLYAIKEALLELLIAF